VRSVRTGMLFKSGRFLACWDIWCFYHDGTYTTDYRVTEYSYGEGVGLKESRSDSLLSKHGVKVRLSQLLSVLLAY